MAEIRIAIPEGLESFDWNNMKPAMFKHENCFIDLEKLIFKNSVTRDGITVGTLHQNYLFEYDNSEDNTKKGKSIKGGITHGKESISGRRPRRF